MVYEILEFQVEFMLDRINMSLNGLNLFIPDQALQFSDQIFHRHAVIVQQWYMVTVMIVFVFSVFGIGVLYFLQYLPPGGVFRYGLGHFLFLGLFFSAFLRSLVCISSCRRFFLYRFL